MLIKYRKLYLMALAVKGEHMKNRPGLKQYIFAALGVVILVLLDQYTKLLGNCTFEGSVCICVVE